MPLMGKDTDKYEDTAHLRNKFKHLSPLAREIACQNVSAGLLAHCAEKLQTAAPSRAFAQWLLQLFSQITVMAVAPDSHRLPFSSKWYAFGHRERLFIYCLHHTIKNMPLEARILRCSFSMIPFKAFAAAKKTGEKAYNDHPHS